jgi:hypothetical protein
MMINPLTTLQVFALVLDVYFSTNIQYEQSIDVPLNTDMLSRTPVL